MQISCCTLLVTCAEDLCTYQQVLDHVQVIKSIVEVQNTLLAIGRDCPFFNKYTLHLQLSVVN